MDAYVQHRATFLECPFWNAGPLLLILTFKKNEQCGLRIPNIFVLGDMNFWSEGRGKEHSCCLVDWLHGWLPLQWSNPQDMLRARLYCSKTDILQNTVTYGSILRFRWCSNRTAPRRTGAETSESSR